MHPLNMNHIVVTWEMFLWLEMYSCDRKFVPLAGVLSLWQELYSYFLWEDIFSVSFASDLFLREFQPWFPVRSLDFVSTWLPGWPGLSHPGLYTGSQIWKLVGCENINLWHIKQNFNGNIWLIEDMLFIVRSHCLTTVTFLGHMLNNLKV